MRATIGIQPAEESHILSLAKETLSQQQEKCQVKLLYEEGICMLKSPCDRRCIDRHVGCHSSCERYLEYSAIVEEARERRNQYKQQEAMFYGHRRR